MQHQWNQFFTIDKPCYIFDLEHNQYAVKCDMFLHCNMSQLFEYYLKWSLLMLNGKIIHKFTKHMIKLGGGEERRISIVIDEFLIILYNRKDCG